MNLRQLATNWYPKFKLSLAHICSMYIDIYEWSPLSYIYIYTQKLLAAEICSLPGRGRIASLSESLFPNRRHYFPFFSPPLVGPRSLLPRRSSKCILNGCRHVLPTLFFLQRFGKNILISSPESQESL